MRELLRDRADELEQMLNWVSDQDRQWWPFVFLRPEPQKRMSSLRVGAFSLLLGVFFGMLANIAVALTASPFATRPDPAVFPLGTALAFFVFFRLTFAYSWNRRAARLSGTTAR
jgi:hypothetical protein